MMKKVLVFEAYPFFSGSQRITYNLCTVLKNNGYSVSLLLADDAFGNHAKKFSSVVDEIFYVHAKQRLRQYNNADAWFSLANFLGGVFLGLLPFYLSVFKTIRDKDYDYYYFCDPRGATMFMPPLLFKKGKKLWHFHGKNKINRFLIRAFFKGVNNVICVSKDVADTLPASRKKKVIYNGIDVSQYSQIDIRKVNLEIKRYLPTEKKTVTFLYAGLIRPHKGLHHLMRSFKTALQVANSINKEVFLFVLGEPKTDAEITFKSKLVNFCDENGLKSNVIWLGWRNDVLSWMKSCSYFIFPSIEKEVATDVGFGNVIESTEGLPTVLIESSLCECFIIASDVTGVREIIKQDENGWVYKADNPDLLEKLLVKAVIEEPKFKSFSSFTDFSFDQFEDQIISVFK